MTFPDKTGLTLGYVGGEIRTDAIVGEVHTWCRFRPRAHVLRTVTLIERGLNFLDRPLRNNSKPHLSFQLGTYISRGVVSMEIDLLKSHTCCKLSVVLMQ